MHYPPVDRKQDFVRRYKAGEFGNHSPTWDTLEEFEYDINCHSHDLYHLRARSKGGKGQYNIPAYKVARAWAKLKITEQYYISGMAPHDYGTIQGDVYVDPYRGGLHLHYNTRKVPMRDGFQVEQLQVCGIMAACLLRQFMCPNSYEWLQVLLRRYPGHIVEFSCFSVPWGTLYPKFNTAFWEVRSY